MLKLKLQYFGHLMQSWLIGKDSDAGRDWGQEEKGTTEDEMAGWHHWLDGRESGWTPAVGDGQGGLACCDSWGRKESDTTERLIWSDLIWTRGSCLESMDRPRELGFGQIKDFNSLPTKSKLELFPIDLALSFSGPQFPHLKNGPTKPHLKSLLWVLNEIIPRWCYFGEVENSGTWVSGYSVYPYWV